MTALHPSRLSVLLSQLLPRAVVVVAGLSVIAALTTDDVAMHAEVELLRAQVEELQQEVVALDARAASRPAIEADARAIPSMVAPDPLGCRIVPAFEAGKVIGFKLFSIPAGSPFARIGLQNGDTITSLNGVNLVTPQSGFDAYQTLRNGTHFTLELQRRGKPMTLQAHFTQSTH